MLNNQIAPWPCFTEEEAQACKQVLLSNKVNYWTGEETRFFEKEFARFVGTEYAIAVANGTVALDLALLCANLSLGDEVIVTPRTFLASVSSIVTAGAVPVFADVDRNTQNITADTIASQITVRTKAIVVVHLAGMPADMDPIMALAKKHNLFVIEDCAQAHGAKYKGQSVGSIGHVGAWSFCQDKIMTTGGEGGIVTLNDEANWNLMWSYKDHGKNYESVYNKEHGKGFRWLHDSFGTNWRMMEMQAVLGRIQLGRLPQWKKNRSSNAERLNAVVEQSPLIRTLTFDRSIYDHAWYKWYGFVNSDYLADEWSRDRIIETLNANGVPCVHGTCSEVYLEAAFDDTNLRPTERLPNAKELGETSICMLVHPTITDKEIEHCSLALQQVCKDACRTEIIS